MKTFITFNEKQIKFKEYIIITVIMTTIRSIIKIKDIGWVIVPIRNTCNDVVQHYDVLSNSYFKDLYSENIIEDYNGKPNKIKIKEQLPLVKTLDLYELD